MINDIERVLLSEEELKEIIKRLGKEITEDYKDKNLLVVSVLKGSVMVMADLLREIKIPCRIDFMSVSSYGSGTKTTGSVKIIKDLDIDLAGYDLLIVEDILDYIHKHPFEERDGRKAQDNSVDFGMEKLRNKGFF